MTRKLPDDILAKIPGTIEATLAGCTCGMAVLPWEAAQVDETTKLGPAPFDVSLAHSNALLALLPAESEPPTEISYDGTDPRLMDFRITSLTKLTATTLNFASAVKSSSPVANESRGRLPQVGDIVTIRNADTAGTVTWKERWLIIGLDSGGNPIAWNPSANLGTATTLGANGDAVTDLGAGIAGRFPWGDVVVGTILDATYRRTAWWSVPEKKIIVADMTSLDGHISRALGPSKASYLDVSELTKNGIYSNCPVHGSGTNPMT
jgi:hypothetical protein